VSSWFGAAVAKKEDLPRDRAIGRQFGVEIKHGRDLEEEGVGIVGYRSSLDHIISAILQRHTSELGSSREVSSRTSGLANYKEINWLSPSRPTA
jgi:hypothetical protein